MKYAVLSFVFSTCMVLAWGQTKVPVENVLISIDNKPTGITIGEKKELLVKKFALLLEPFIYKDSYTFINPCE